MTLDLAYHLFIFKGQTDTALSVSGTKENETCVSIVSLELGQKVSDDPVSPAVSLPVSPSTDENYKTESDGSQRSNQSGRQRSEKPNCYECKYRSDLVGDAHSKCLHPRITDEDRIITGFALMAGKRSAAMKRLNVSGHEHGIRNGWFYWPLNFDPTWLITCDGFEEAARRVIEGKL